MKQIGKYQLNEDDEIVCKKCGHNSFHAIRECNIVMDIKNKQVRVVEQRYSDYDAEWHELECEKCGEIMDDILEIKHNLQKECE